MAGSGWNGGLRFRKRWEGENHVMDGGSPPQGFFLSPPTTLLKTINRCHLPFYQEKAYTG